MPELEQLMRTIPPAYHELARRFYQAGQEHVFTWWGELSARQRSDLLSHLESIELNLTTRLLEQHVLNKKRPAQAPEIEPAPYVPVPRQAAQVRRADEARQAGEQFISAGKVAAFVVAGGQATRLGFSGPKGAFPVGPVSDRTLFQIHAEKILALQRRYRTRIPWYVMTSSSNDARTRSFLQERDYFGLQEEDVFIFQQGMLPASDFAGKLVMDEKHHLSMSPNGHGGSLSALYESGALEDMKSRGIEEIYYFQVDNPLLRIADPIFLGYHLQAKAEMSSKVVPKRDPEEKVGVVCFIDGKPGVVEYSDLNDEDKYATNPDGSLKFAGGNIAIHFVKRSFVEELNREGFQLPYHAARKKVPCINEKGEHIEPSEPNAIKFETFVFDALKFTTSTVTMEVERPEEFSPVKNASGQDSLETAQRDMTALYACWLEEAGIKVPRDDRGETAFPIEISPLTALDAEELEGKVPAELKITDKLLL